MRFVPAEISGIQIVEPRCFGDDRGLFFECYRQDRFAAAGIPEAFVQWNHSESGVGTLRGLHFQQEPYAQGKLIRVVQGEVCDVAVDLRHGSPSFGKWVAVELTAANQRSVYIPPGFAHGFLVTAGPATVIYGCTQVYRPEAEVAIRWDDPDLAIAWGQSHPLLSTRDAGALTWRQCLARFPLFRYTA